MFEQKMARNQEGLHGLFGYSISINRAWSNQSGGIPCCSRESNGVTKCSPKKIKTPF